MKYFYVSHRTQDTFIKDLKEKPTYHILYTYKLIKKIIINGVFFYLMKEN